MARKGSTRSARSPLHCYCPRHARLGRPTDSSRWHPAKAVLFGERTFAGRGDLGAHLLANVPALALGVGLPYDALYGQVKEDAGLRACLPSAPPLRAVARRQLQRVHKRTDARNDHSRAVAAHPERRPHTTTHAMERLAARQCAQQNCSPSGATHSVDAVACSGTIVEPSALE